jgi:hypothetical protein
MQPLNAGILIRTLGGVFPKSCYLRRGWDRLSFPESAGFTLPVGREEERQRILRERVPTALSDLQLLRGSSRYGQLLVAKTQGRG